MITTMGACMEGMCEPGMLDIVVAMVIMVVVSIYVAGGLVFSPW
ncbi:MAG: hypothetical protein QUS33_05990 [Dehalococcoidia bacterium]|nr:hypothetical protein [Dehalococcoidia bacterium]